MKAQVIREFGEPEVFHLVDLPEPEVEAGHVLIEVSASSVNPVDCKIRRFGPPVAPDLPAILHGDVAGTVVAVGEGVSRFQTGDQVYACAGGVKGNGGAIAQYMLADAALVAKKPATLSFLEAAALPLVSITAWEALFDRAKLQRGQRVLIHAATGGVGHIAVQLAKWAGAKVYTTVSGRQPKYQLAQKLGADVVIDYHAQSVADYVQQCTGGEGFDLVFDTVGKENLDRSFAAARIGGTVVSISTNSSHNLSPMHSKGLTLHVVYMLLPLLYNRGRARHGQILTDLARLVDQGRLRPLMDEQVFGFSQVSQAHRHWESGRAIGKIVLKQDLF